jgi:hypothetical protein
MEHDSEKLEAIPVGKGKRFQSEKAAEAVIKERAPKVEEIRSAEIGAEEPIPSAEMVEDPFAKIVINPRKTIPRTRIGHTWYTFEAGKKVIVPRFVATLLEEKGII